MTNFIFQFYVSTKTFDQGLSVISVPDGSVKGTLSGGIAERPKETL
jgi:hypothetical protein